MEQITYEDILQKIGEERDFSTLTEEELHVYDLVKAVRNVASKEEKGKIVQAVKNVIIPDANPEQNLPKGRLIPFIGHWKMWHLAAAGVALMIGSYSIVRSLTSNSQNIFKENFKQETQLIINVKENLTQYGLIDQQVESRDSLLKGLEFYENKKFNEAIELLSNYTKQYPNAYLARFYLALSQISVDEFEQAQTNLYILTEIANLEFAEDVSWYYVLSLLKTEKGSPKVKLLLDQIAKSNRKYGPTAKEILEKL